MRRALFLVGLLTITLLAVSCGSPAPGADRAPTAPASLTTTADHFPNSPEGAVQKMLDAIEKGDANQYLDAVTPEDRKEPGFVFYQQLADKLPDDSANGVAKPASPGVAFRDITYDTVNSGSDSAFVNVSGKLRDLNLTVEHDFNTVVNVVRRDGSWLCAVHASEADRTALDAQALTFVRAAKSYRGKGSEQTLSNEGSVLTAQVEIEESLDARSGRIIRAWEDGKTSETVWVGEQMCMRPAVDAKDWICEEQQRDDWRAPMQWIITGSGSPLGRSPAEGQPGHGARAEQIEGKPCWVYWRTGQISGDQSHYELFVDLDTARPLRLVRTDVKAGAQALTLTSETRYTQFDQPLVIELPMLDQVPQIAGTKKPPLQSDAGSPAELAFRQQALVAVQAVKSVQASGTQTYSTAVDHGQGQVQVATNETGRSAKSLFPGSAFSGWSESRWVGRRVCYTLPKGGWACSDEAAAPVPEPEAWAQALRGELSEYQIRDDLQLDRSGSYLSEREGRPCRVYYVVASGLGRDAGAAEKDRHTETVQQYCFDGATMLPITSEYESKRKEGEPTINQVTTVLLTYFGYNEPIEIVLPSQ